MLLLSAALIAGLVAVSAPASGGQPTASAAKKKCDQKNKKKRKKCKKKRSQSNANQPAAPAPTPASLSITPTSMDFGPIANGTSSDFTTFTVTNSGDLTSAPISAGVNGANPDQFPFQHDHCSGAGLFGGLSCTMQVRFAPTSSGAKGAQLDVFGGAQAFHVPLSGSGGTPPALTIAPLSHNFGSVFAGSTLVPSFTNPFTFTVTNNGAFPTGALTSVIAGADSSQFNAASGPTQCGIPLGSGQTCNVTITFAPSSSGAKSASLTVGDSILSSTGPASLTGTATGLSISPAGHAFGTVNGGSSSAPFNFTVTNNDPLLPTGTFGAPMIGGANSSEYSVGANTCVGALLPSTSCTFQVTFNPMVTIFHPRPTSATVSIGATPGGSPVASLTGTEGP